MRTALHTLVVLLAIVALTQCGGPRSRGNDTIGGGADGNADAGGAGAGAGAGGGADAGGNGAGNDAGNGAGNDAGADGGQGDANGGDDDGGAEIDIIPDGGGGDGDGDEGAGDGGDPAGAADGNGEGGGAQGDGDGAGDADGNGDGGNDELCGDKPEVEDAGDTQTPCDSDGLVCDPAVGQGCTADQDRPGSYECDVMGPNGESQPCGQARGGCGNGLICVNFGDGGICMRMCVENDHCPGDRQCNGSDINGENGFLTKTCGAGPAGCNPYCSVEHCPQAMGCYGSADAGFSCRPPSAEAVGAGESCQGDEENTYDPSRCQIGHFCQSDVNPPVCRKICHLSNDSADCPDDQICQGFISLEGGLDQVRYCI